MKKNRKVKDDGTTTEHLDEGNKNLNKKDPLEMELTKPIKEEKKEDDIEPVSFFRLFRFSTGTERFLLFIGFLGALVTASTAPLNILLFGNLTEDLVTYGAQRTSNSTEPGSNSERLDSDAFLHSVQIFAIYNSILGFVMLVVTYVSVWTYNFVANRQILRIRSLYLKSALSQDIGWYDVQQTGDFASRMSEDLTKLEDGIGDKVVQCIHFMASFVGCIILAFVKGWLLALVCLSSLPITLIAVGIVSVISSRLAKKELVAYGIAGAIAEEVLSSIRTVIAFGGQVIEVKRYTSNLVYAKSINVKRAFLSGIGFGFLWFCIYASYALAFWYGVGLVLDADEPTYTPGTMVMVFFGVMMASMNFGMTSPFIESFAIAKGAGAKVFSVIDRVSPINSWSPDGTYPEQMKGNLSFRDVHFEYPTRSDVKVLQGLNLDINNGEKVALVGSSGCGKSTCIQLIQRFYDPRQGTVMVDGNDVKELNVAWLRKHIGVVGQEPVLFNTTISENISFGAEGATEKDIEEAAREANAHDFISKLPLGYNTLVGERGAQLSGGQKQRIAIARALVRKPVILLLDEATSALDTSSESKVQKALDKVSKGRTTVIVAHRLSTIRTADKIVAISDGKVVEQGTHVELLAKKGHYHALVNAQHLNTIDEMENGNQKESEDLEDGKLGRLMRTVSRTSSTGSASHIHEDERLPVMEDAEEEEPPPISMLTILKKNMPEWQYIVLGSVGSIIIGFAMPIFGVLFGGILGVMAESDADAVREGTNQYSLYFVIAGVTVGIATFVQFFTYGVAGEKLTMRLRGEMFQAMVRQEVAWFDIKSNSSGALCARLSGDASSVQGATGQRVGIVLQSIATIGLGIGLAMYYEWRLGLVVLCFTPPILLAQYFYLRIARGETLNNQKALERSTKLAVEAVGNIRTVAGLGREKTFHQQYMSELLPAFNQSQVNTHLRAAVFGLARSIMFFAYATAMYYGGRLIVEEGVHFEDILKTSQALIMSTMSIANAMGFAPNFQKGLTAASHIFQLLNRKPQMYDSVDNGKNWQAEGNVSYEEIEFFYPTRPNVTVLQGLNVDVPKGQTVALVGHSGCGKSTCIQLLVRFYDPVSGSVHIDEHDVSLISMRLLRLQLGIVSQEPVLFDRTIAENIAYGDNSRKVPMPEIIEAAKQANIHNFIHTLPLGYETRMGEKGTQLSGGQKQRVAIARALIRNPRILLLDEATSALDTESEKVVQEALDKAKEGRTCITIAHRLSTIQDADVIFVINKGQVAEMGTHGELLAKHGLYYQLCAMQSGLT